MRTNGKRTGSGQGVTMEEISEIRARPAYQGFRSAEQQSKISFLEGGPKIQITRLASQKMKLIVEHSPLEVSWLGSVKRSGMTFLIEDVFLITQEVGSIHTVLDLEEVNKFFDELLDEPGGREKANSILFWGHSHVNIPVHPSGVYKPGSYGDLSTMHMFSESGSDYFIMGIANKQGDLRFELFLYDSGIRIENVPSCVVEEEDPELKQSIISELRAKVTESYVPPVVTKAKPKAKKRGPVPPRIAERIEDMGGFDPRDFDSEDLESLFEDETVVEGLFGEERHNGRH